MMENVHNYRYVILVVTKNNQKYVCAICDFKNIYFLFLPIGVVESVFEMHFSTEGGSHYEIMLNTIIAHSVSTCDIFTPERI
jgi:hypothetical protein